MNVYKLYARKVKIYLSYYFEMQPTAMNAYKKHSPIPICIPHVIG